MAMKDRVSQCVSKREEWKQHVVKISLHPNDRPMHVTDNFIGICQFKRTRRVKWSRDNSFAVHPLTFHISHLHFKFVVGVQPRELLVLYCFVFAFLAASPKNKRRNERFAQFSVPGTTLK